MSSGRKRNQCQCVNSYLFPHRVDRCLLRRNGILPPTPHPSPSSAAEEEPEAGEDIPETVAEVLPTASAEEEEVQSSEIVDVYLRFFDPDEPWDEDCFESADEVTAVEPSNDNNNEEYSGMFSSSSSVTPVLEPLQTSPQASQCRKTEPATAPTLTDPQPIPVRRQRAEQCDCFAYAFTKHRKSKCRWNEYREALAVAGAVGLTVAAAGVAVAAAMAASDNTSTSPTASKKDLKS